MVNIALGQSISNFTASATSNSEVSLLSLKGRNVVLYFYPKDNTPGCTNESKGFRDQYEEFRALDTIVFGISRDTLRSHENFKSKLTLPFELISDEDEILCQLFDVIKEKNMYGKTFMGIERSTFLIDKQGVLRNEWRKVKIKGHIDSILDAIKKL